MENRLWFKGVILGRCLEGGWSVAKGEVSKTILDFSTTTITSSANGDNKFSQDNIFSNTFMVVRRK